MNKVKFMPDFKHIKKKLVDMLIEIPDHSLENISGIRAIGKVEIGKQMKQAIIYNEVGFGVYVPLSKFEHLINLKFLKPLQDEMVNYSQDYVTCECGSHNMITHVKPNCKACINNRSYTSIDADKDNWPYDIQVSEDNIVPGCEIEEESTCRIGHAYGKGCTISECSSCGNVVVHIPHIGVRYARDYS